MNRAALVVTLLCITVYHITAGSLDPDTVLNASPFKRGVVCIPDCGSDESVLELAQKSELFILAMDEDEQNVKQLREKALKSGLLGRRLYVEQGSKEHIPFADNYVDLLVLQNLAGKDLTDRLADEINRVLTPVNGIALIGGKLDPEKLKIWKESEAESLALHSSALRIPNSAFVLQLRKPRLPGADDWTHNKHDAGNNPVSTDRIFLFPPLLQFRGMPEIAGTWSHGSLARGGIHIQILGDRGARHGNRQLVPGILARNAYNGRLLWVKKLPMPDGAKPPFYDPAKQTIAFTDTALLVGREADAAVLRFNPATGDEFDPVLLGSKDTRLHWLAYENGVLFALLLRLEEIVTPAPLDNKFLPQYFGNRIIAWDLEKEKLLWQHETPDIVDGRTVALHEQHLYYYAERTGIYCLDTETGKRLWENRADTWPAEYKQIRKDSFNPPNLRNSTMVTADALVLLTLAYESVPSLVFRASDGELLSKIGGKRGIFKSLILKGEPVFNGIRFDPATGKKSGGVASPAGTYWCGITTFSPGTDLLGAWTLNFKPMCGSGAWVADGVLHYSVSHCPGCSRKIGAAGFVSGAEIHKRFRENPEHPLIKGKAYGTLDSRLSPLATPSDWRQYRGDDGHRGSSPVSVGKNAELKWKADYVSPPVSSATWQGAGFRERPVPLVCVGDTVFSVDSDGVVRALSLKDGRELWRFCTGGPVFTSPAFSAGLLFVPCADGWVYALNAAAGDLSWKRRLAPLDRRILVFDQLVSTWPVLSLTVYDGVLYAAAGYSETDGVKSFALNASTGEVLWSHADEPGEKRFLGKKNNADKPVQGIGGNLCVVGNRIWGAGFFTPPLVLDRKDGSDHQKDLKHELFVVTEKRYRWWDIRLNWFLRGQDMIRVNNRLVLAGGGPLLDNQGRGGDPRQIYYRLFFCDENGDWVKDKVPCDLFHSRIAPACDEKLLVFAGSTQYQKDKGIVRKDLILNVTLGLNAWSMTDFCKTAENVKQQRSFGENSKGFLDETPPFRKLFKYEGAAWRKNLDINALALTENAVLAAHGIPADKKHYTFKFWSVTAFSRDGKETLWTVELPSEPLFNGLAVARDGSVLVILRDGSIVCIGNGE